MERKKKNIGGLCCTGSDGSAALAANERVVVLF